MNDMVAINQIGEMIVIHTDNPNKEVISDRLQMLLMADVDPRSIVVFDNNDYTVYTNRARARTLNSVPGIGWAAPMCFIP